MRIPKKIYLTNEDDDIVLSEEQIQCGDVLWCEDKTSDNDIEYIRADIAKDMVRDLLIYIDDIYKNSLGDRLDIEERINISRRAQYLLESK